MTAVLPAPAAPRFATPRDPRLPTFGPAIAKVADAMGTPLMPWQRTVADVVGEVLPDGRFRHPLVVISVPRQAGKTTLVMAIAVHRALYRARQRVWYTAQTGKDAAEKWQEMVDQVRAIGSPMRDLTTKEKRTQGSWSLPFTTGSTLAPHPPTRDGLHGKQSDLNLIDEAWSHDDLSGAELMQAIVPTQATRPFRQTILLSTMGSARSTWFHAYSDRVRAGDPGIAGFEWSVPDDVEDPDDFESIALHHPAFGYTIDLQALRDARAQIPKAGEYLRAYGNRRTGAAERVLPAGPWTDAATLDTIPTTARVGIGGAVAEDSSDAAIVACAIVDGRPLFEVIDHRPGTSWHAPRLVELSRRHKGATCVDRVGPAGGVAAEVERAGVELVELQTKTVAAACSDLLSRVVEPGLDGRPRLGYRPHAGLDDAAKIATKRGIGDGAWLWSRRGSLGSIAVLEAMTCALIAAHAAPAPAVQPMMV